MSAEIFTPNLSPSLFIALGSTGLDILSRFQELVLEHYGVASLPMFSYLAIETDEKAAAKPLDWGGNEITLVAPVIRSTDAIKNAIDAGRKDYLREWLNEELLNISGNQFTEGASNIRMAGRLILWENWSKIAAELMNARDSILGQSTVSETEAYLQKRYKKYGVVTDDKRPIVDDRKPNIYILGTLCGGSCSGMFIDIAYFIKEISGLYAKDLINPNLPKVIGIFTGFDSSALNRAQEENIKGHAANTWAALQEYDFYCHPNTRYRATYPDGKKLDTNEPPLDWLYFLSPSATDANNRLRSNFRTEHETDIKSLNHMAAMVAFTETVGGLAAVKGSIRTDYRSGTRAMSTNAAQHSPCLATCGMAAVWYPRYRIALGATCVHGIGLCRRWLREPNVDEKDGIARQVSERWEDLFAKHVDTLISRTSTDVMRSDWQDAKRSAESGRHGTLLTEEFARKLATRKLEDMELAAFEGELQELLFMLNEGEMHEREINNKDRKARLFDLLRKGIDDLICTVLDQTQSVAFARYALGFLDSEIQEKIELLPSSYPVPNPDLFHKIKPDLYGRVAFRSAALVQEYKADIVADLGKYIINQIKRIRNWVAVEVLELIRRELGVGVQLSAEERKAERRTLRDKLEKITESVDQCSDSLHKREKELRTRIEDTQDVRIVSTGADNSISEDIDRLSAKLIQLQPDEAERLQRYILSDNKLSVYLGFDVPEGRGREIEESILEHVSGHLLRGDQDFDVLQHVLSNWRAADLATFAKHALPHLELEAGTSNLASVKIGRPVAFIAGGDLSTVEKLVAEKLKGTEVENVFAPNLKSPLAVNELTHMLLFYREEPQMYIDENIQTARLFARCYEELSIPGSYGRHIHKGGRSVFDPKIYARVDETRKVLMPVAENILSQRGEGGGWVSSEIFSVENGALVLRGKQRNGISFRLSSDEHGIQLCGQESEVFDWFKEAVHGKLDVMSREQLVDRLNVYLDQVEQLALEEGIDPANARESAQKNILGINIIATKVNL